MKNVRLLEKCLAGASQTGFALVAGSCTPPGKAESKAQLAFTFAETIIRHRKLADMPLNPKP